MATYLITFTSYGSHIPGQEGAIDRNHNRFGARVPEPRPKLRQYVDRSLKQASYEMEVEQQAITLKAIQDVCRHKGWFSTPYTSDPTMSTLSSAPTWPRSLP